MHYVKLLLACLVLALAQGFLQPVRPRVAVSKTALRMSDEDAAAESDWVGAQAWSSKTDGVPKVAPVEDIQDVLPHRYPFALVDKILEFKEGEKVVGVKCITMNEPQFTGHFPGRPIMPGVLMVEAMAQLGGYLCLKLPENKPGSIFFFGGVDGVRWKKPVVPGDTLVMEMELKTWKPRFGMAKMTGKAYVDGALAVDVAEFTFAVAKDQ
ncbi:unnamed protein product [Heterosigma akashiwo]